MMSDSQCERAARFERGAVESEQAHGALHVNNEHDAAARAIEKDARVRTVDDRTMGVLDPGSSGLNQGARGLERAVAHEAEQASSA